jgi:hypothetical protein
MGSRLTGSNGKTWTVTASVIASLTRGIEDSLPACAGQPTGHVHPTRATDPSALAPPVSDGGADQAAPLKQSAALAPADAQPPLAQPHFGYLILAGLVLCIVMFPIVSAFGSQYTAIIRGLAVKASPFVAVSLAALVGWLFNSSRKEHS